MENDKKKQTEDSQEEDGQELCPKCGNIMVDEGGDKTCSSCSEDIDFFGEDEEPDQDQPT
ncbi:MAG: hypothetical protein Q7S53_02110 [bacterium]|nr:hypothetical protein [bacterium]